MWPGARVGEVALGKSDAAIADAARGAFWQPIRVVPERAVLLLRSLPRWRRRDAELADELLDAPEERRALLVIAVVDEL